MWITHKYLTNSCIASVNEYPNFIVKSMAPLPFAPHPKQLKLFSGYNTNEGLLSL